MNKTVLVLLHGALGSSAEWTATQNLLQTEIPVLAPNFPGHSGTPLPENGLQPQVLVDFVTDYCKANAPEASIILCGHSMGGYVAMLVALQNKLPVKGIITLGTKFHWSTEIAEQETGMLNPQTMEEKVPRYAAALTNLHGESTWKQLIFQMGDFLEILGKTNPLNPDSIKGLDIPCRLMLGDRDTMVSRKETMDIAESLSLASLSILPDTPHALAKVNPERLAFEIRDFIARC
jgi:pimeloyl-ACP methyl ester carboxylesterase